MTSDTESLRQKFERHIVATGRSEGELIFEAGHYLYPDVQEIWELYQAGHAAAKAETAEVEEPLFWFRPSSVNGLYEGPLHNAQIEQVRKDSGAWVPLYTASKLAAAVAAERDYWRNELHALLEAADAVATNNAHAVSIGSVRYAKHSQTWKAYASLDRARQRASDAIRAGAEAR